MQYQLLAANKEGVPSPCIFRVDDNAYIPMDEGNMDYIAYQAWVASGNTPLPASQGE